MLQTHNKWTGKHEGKMESHLLHKVDFFDLFQLHFMFEKITCVLGLLLSHLLIPEHQLLANMQENILDKHIIVNFLL